MPSMPTQSRGHATRSGPPRLPKEREPGIPRDGAIPDDPDSMPDEIGYDETRRRLTIGEGLIDNVPLL